MIEAKIDTWKVDIEAKAVFREALSAHEAGHYRSVCRLLLPEIERVSRIELHDGQVGINITSQKKLKELAGELFPTSVEPRGPYSLSLFIRLSDHLYAKVSDADAKRRMEDDPVPNRHAAVHGLIVYSSMQNSINSIFMTDYIFQVITALKANQLDDDE